MTFIAFAGAGVIPFSFAQTPTPPQNPPAAAAVSDFDKQSLAVRTALHFDPSLDSPLKSLIALYRNANRLEELVGLYRGHIAQYPADAGAKAVLIRVLRELGRAEADELVQSAVQQHGDELALLHLLHFESRSRRKDPRALESLARAVDLETRPSVRDAWAERLLKESAEGGPGQALARAYLEKTRQAEGHTAETLRQLGDRMHRHGFYDLAVATLTEAAKLKPATDLLVEIEVLLARSQAALGDRAAAGARLAALGARLAPDHWRRQEITSLRVGLLTTAADRTELIAAAREAHETNPGDEAAALEYADVLTASELPREALGVLRGASELLPQSERVEQRMLAVLDRLADAKAAESYLTARLEQFPKRPDLRFRLVKALHALGRAKDAGPHLDQMLFELTAEEADRHLIDLARHLRDSKRESEAAKLFQKAVDAHPERFDLRRELAEVHLARQDAAAARSVLKNLPVADTAIENFLDLVDFMIVGEFLAEARAALEARLALAGAEGRRLDLMLPLATVLAKVGDRARAAAQIEKSRDLADTPARYRAWLDAGLGVHEIFGELERFFDDEQQRLLTGEATPDRSERFLIFCELGEEKRLESRVNQALRAQLEKTGLPADLRLRLRRLLVKGLERTPERAAEAEEQLQLLAKDDPARSNEYDLRRALMYHALDRTDLARTALEAIKIESVTELPLLRAAHPIFVEYGMPAAARHCLERMTESEPTDLVAWQRRLSLLAGLGDEEGLRSAIRSLLAFGGKVALGPKSIDSLRRHLLDSLWRSVSQQIGTGTAAGAAETLALLDAVAREAPAGDDRLWSLWAKALALGQAGQTISRDAAIVDFAELAKSTANHAGGDPAALEIAFPDGLVLPLQAALRQLTEPFPEKAREESPSQGPVGAPELAWVFEADPGVRILQMEPVNTSLIILDDAGTFYRLDSATGKLIWRETFRSGAEPVDQPQAPDPAAIFISGINAQYQQVGFAGPRGSPFLFNTRFQRATDPSSTAGIKLPRRWAYDAEGRMFIPVGREIEARSIETGDLIWTAHLNDLGHPVPQGPRPGLARPETQILIDGGRLLAFVPESAIAAAMDPASGKLLWERRLESPKPDGNSESLISLNCGATARDGQFFVYGRQAEILDSETGATLWRFDTGTPSAFPIVLRDPPGERGSSLPVAFGSRPPGFLDHQTPALSRADSLKSFLENPGSLLTPAAHWSAARLYNPGGVSHASIAPQGRLLLFSGRQVRVISLSLPLASRPIPASGEFLGTAGNWAWFFGGQGMHRIDLRGGAVEVIPHDLAEPARAVLSGSRIYAFGSNGVTVFHAHDGSRIGNWAWPAALTEYLARNPVASSSGEVPVHLWQGAIHTGASGQTFCLPARDRVSDDTLFVLQGDRVISALRAENSKP